MLQVKSSQTTTWHNLVDIFQICTLFPQIKQIKSELHINMTDADDKAIAEWFWIGIYSAAGVVLIFFFRFLLPKFKMLIARRRHHKAVKAAESRRWPASPHKVFPDFINTAASPPRKTFSRKTLSDADQYTKCDISGSHGLQDLEAARTARTTY